MARGKGSIQGWITKNGVHIPIYGEYTVRGGVEPKAKGAKWGKKKKRPATVTRNMKTGQVIGKKYKFDGNVVKGKKSAEEMTGQKLSINEIENNGLETVYAFKDKDGNEVGRFFESHTNKKANKMELYDKKSEKKERNVLGQETDFAEVDRTAKEREKDFIVDTPITEKRVAKDEARRKKMEAADEADAYDRAHGEGKYKGSNYYEERQNQAAAENAAEVRKTTNGDFSLEDYERRQQEKATKKIEAREQSFRDKKAQELGFADDASMRSYNEETGVNKESWEKKSTPESYAKSQGKSIKDIASEVNNDEYGRSQANQLMKDGRSYDEAAALAHMDMQNKVKNMGTSREAAINEMKSRYENNDYGKTKKNPGMLLMSKNGQYKTIDAQDSATYKKDGWNMETVTSDEANYVQGTNYNYNERLSTTSKAAKPVDVDAATSGNTARETAKARNSYRESNEKIANGEHTVDIKTDGTKRGINNAKKSITKAAKKNDVNYGISEHKGVVTGSRMAENGATLDSNIRSMSVSGLKQAYNTATGTAKSKIRAELRRLGYTYVGGKWVKGK